MFYALFPSTIHITLKMKAARSSELWNIGILPHHYMMSQPRRPWLEASLLWKPQVSDGRDCCSKEESCKYDSHGVIFVIQINFHMKSSISCLMEGRTSQENGVLHWFQFAIGLYGCDSFILLWGKTVNYKYLKTKCLGNYLDQRQNLLGIWNIVSWRTIIYIILVKVEKT